jgi:replicative DNA helicase
MLADQTRWSQAHGKTPVPSRWQATTKSLAPLADAPLYIDDSVAFNVSMIRAKAKQTKRNHGLGLLVVDPIQALLPFRRVENLYEQASF